MVIGNHLTNHQNALSGNSAVSGFRKSVSGFWNTQTLERVHLKWRQYGSLRSTALGSAGLAAHWEGGALESSSNRLPAAWRSLSSVQGKTTTVWLSVLFLVI